VIASLPMYDRPETAGAHDRLWMTIRDAMRTEGLAAPEALTRGTADLWPEWTAPDLVLTQTCGLPYRARLHGLVTLVATPDYGVEGCALGHYRSVLVARADDPRDDLAAFDGAAFAYNDPLSQSGWAAAFAHFARLDLRLRPVLCTGAHRLSARAVADGQAEIAALDAVTWSMMRRWDTVTARLRVVGVTEPTPGLPLIAAAGADVGALRAIVAAAIDSLPPEDRDATGLRGLAVIPADDYLAMPAPPAPEAAFRAG
jgi:ABC-type phosphate/phosphonate transport system substrate-binding protein